MRSRSHWDRKVAMSFSTNLTERLESARTALLSPKNSRKVSTNDEIAQIGTVSANGDVEIGRMMAEAMQRVGNEGVITVEEAKSLATELEVVEGMQFDRGYVSPYFITNAEKMVAEF